MHRRFYNIGIAKLKEHAVRDWDESRERTQPFPLSEAPVPFRTCLTVAAGSDPTYVAPDTEYDVMQICAWIGPLAPVASPTPEKPRIFARLPVTASGSWLHLD